MNRAYLRPPLPLFRWFAVVATPFLIWGIGALSVGSLPPLQQEYFGRYLRSVVQSKSAKPVPRDFFCYTVSGHEVPVRGRLDASRNPHWSKLLVRDYERWLEQAIFDGRDIKELIRWPLVLGTLLGIVLFALGWWADQERRLHFRCGRLVRGPRIVNRGKFRREVKGGGLGWRTDGHRTLGEWAATVVLALRQLVRGEHRAAWSELLQGATVKSVRIEQHLENHHLSVMGAPGSGKTSLLMQLADEAIARGMAVVFHDPHLQFVKRYYREDSDDRILNPADARCPHWNPSDEIDYSDRTSTMAQAGAFAESLYPGSPHRKDWFFTDACRRVVKHVLTWHKPNASQLAEMLTHMDPILDAVSIGTELEGMLRQNADGQRAGIEGTLSQAAESFRQIPENDGRPTWSVRAWAQERKGNLFITNTAKTRTGLRPLQTLWMDMLIREILTVGEQPNLPGVVMIIDEMAALSEIGQLGSAFREMRKAGLMIVVAYQDRGSLKAIYGEEVESIFGGPETKVILRVGEPEGADWASRMVGEQDVERVREHRGTKGERTYTTEIAKNERAVMASELAGLKPRVGYLRYGDLILKMKIALADRRVPGADEPKGFIQRTGEPVEPRPMPNLEELLRKKEEERRKETAKVGGVIYRPEGGAATAVAGEEGGEPTAPWPEMEDVSKARRPRSKKGPPSEQGGLWKQQQS